MKLKSQQRIGNQPVLSLILTLCMLLINKHSVVIEVLEAQMISGKVRSETSSILLMLYLPVNSLAPLRP